MLAGCNLQNSMIEYPKKEVLNMEERLALVAMSGGVDSSVAAYLTRQSGYRCIGAIARLCDSSLPGCADPQGSIADARAVAQRLGMEFTVLERTAQFRKEVVDYFVDTYKEGQTPNPCVRCNRAIKFGDLLEQALAVNFGVPVDANIVVNFEGFKSIIDMLGGITINLTEEEVKAPVIKKRFR